VSDLTPYEKELLNQLNNLPLPDEDQAWKDMKEMLDNDDNKGGGAKPTSDNRIWGIILLIFLINACILWYARPTKLPIISNTENNKTGTVKKDLSTETTTNNETQKISPVTISTEKNTIHNKDTSTESKPAEKNNINTTDPFSSENKKGTTKFPSSNIHPDNTENNSTSSSPDKNDASSKNSSTTENHSIKRIKFSKINNKKSKLKNIRSWSNNNSYPNNNLTHKNTNPAVNKNKTGYNTINETNNNNNSYYSLNNKNSLHLRSPKASHIKGKKNYINSAAPTTQLTNSNNAHPYNKGKLIVNNRKKPHYHITNSNVETDDITATDTPISDKTNQEIIKKDTSSIQPVTPKKTVADSLLKKPLIAAKNSTDTTKKDKKQDKNKRNAYFAAGIADQQSLDKSCNCAYPDNLPAKAIARDYIPSVFLGFYDKKWFLQTEFKYAAPQYVNGFTYRVIQDVPLLLNDTSTTFTIKKIYGHQGSISFNYCILPDLSIGTGLIYNIFAGADIEKTVKKKSYGPTDSLISSTMITDKDDSGLNGLAKNDFQLLLQAQYQWNRFSFGTSYSIGLTPYIKYTDPYSKTPAQKDNNTFNVFIKYELWKQR
jgi:hypothetical protein